jgi:hypothetical protein
VTIPRRTVSAFSAQAEHILPFLTPLRHGQTIGISSTTQIKGFIALAVEAEPIQFHHSHPQDEVTVEIGCDSQA